MSDTWLILDVNYLAYRALYTTGGLTYNGKSTGVLYGLFREMFSLRDEFNSNHIVWCFDHGKNLRKKMLPSYKEGREAKDKNHEKQIIQLKEQLEELKTRLRKICPNVIMKKGYEADDCMAVSSHDIRTRFPGDRCVIVSADKDMWQCLKKEPSEVVVYDPRQSLLVTHDWFVQRYGIYPVDWIIIKSIAGCSTDKIKGVRGVGEKTAINYITGQLGQGSRLEKKIVKAYKKGLIKFNKKLVKLPFDPKKEYDVSNSSDWLGREIVKEVDPWKTDKDWKPLFREYGFQSLMR